MAGTAKGTAFGTGVDPASTADNCGPMPQCVNQPNQPQCTNVQNTPQPQAPQPSGMMIGPSTTGCYVRPMPYGVLPDGYSTTPTEGQYGYGYYNQSNPEQYLGTAGIYHMPNNAMWNAGMGGSRGGHACGPCGNVCFSGLATTPVNACGYDQGGVPVTIAALERYDSPQAVAQNSLQNWAGVLHVNGCANATNQIAQWGGLEGASRGLCIYTGLRKQAPCGITVCPSYGPGGLNNGQQGPIYYTNGCIVTFMHELQEVMNANPCTSRTMCGNSVGEDSSDVRYNPVGTPAHCNNFKSCTVGYNCFDSALTAYFGTTYGTTPDAWGNAKTAAYRCGELIGPQGGPGGPGAPTAPFVNGPVTVTPGGVVVNLPGIPQAPAAHSSTNTSKGRRKLQNAPSAPVSPYPYAYGGRIPGYAVGGHVVGRAGCCNTPCTPACKNPKPSTPPPKTPPNQGPPVYVNTPPVTVNIPPPGGQPQGPANIVPFVSVSPAYPYRGAVCANKITYPGGETWNYPLGTPEVPGGPGIPTPPSCAPKAPPGCKSGAPGSGGKPSTNPNPIIPLTNYPVPGVTGIQVGPDGSPIFYGPCGPMTNPVKTGASRSIGRSHGHAHGRSCGPCTPCAPKPCAPCAPKPCGAPKPCAPCAPKPCAPCAPNPCGPKPCSPCKPCAKPNPSPYGTVSPFMPCYMGVSPWPSPQNVWGGPVPLTPWLPGGKVDNGLGPTPAMPASPVYGPAPNTCAAFVGPHIPAPQMPFAAPSSTTTTTTTGGICTSNIPTYCQWDQMEDAGMLANNYTMGGNCAWSFLANLQNGNVAFPTAGTQVSTVVDPGLAPVTPGQCGNLAAYPGSDKWTGVNPNPYITAPAAPAPSPCGAPCGSPCGSPCNWNPCSPIGCAPSGASHMQGPRHQNFMGPPVHPGCVGGPVVTGAPPCLGNVPMNCKVLCQPGQPTEWHCYFGQAIKNIVGDSTPTGCTPSMPNCWSPSAPGCNSSPSCNSAPGCFMGLGGICQPGQPGSIPSPCLMAGDNLNYNGTACFGGTQWNNSGVWGGWGSPYQGSNEPNEDSAEAWAQQNWCNLWAQDIAKQRSLSPPATTTTTTQQNGIPCWNPPNWNNGNNPAFGNTSSPVGQGQYPSWPGQAPGTGAPSVGGYSRNNTPFQNGDLYHPGFENVGSNFQGNPWQPTCLGLVNPGAISMGLAGFQVPAQNPAPTPSPAPTCQPGCTTSPGCSFLGLTGGFSKAGSAPSFGAAAHHAHGGSIGNMVDVELSPGEDVIMPGGSRMKVPGEAKYPGDTTKNDTYRTQLPPGAVVIPRSVSGNSDKEKRFVAAVMAKKSPAEALRRAHG